MTALNNSLAENEAISTNQQQEVKALWCHVCELKGDEEREREETDKAHDTVCSLTDPLEILHSEDEAQHKAEWERVKQLECEKGKVVREL